MVSKFMVGKFFACLFLASAFVMSVSCMYRLLRLVFYEARFRYGSPALTLLKVYLPAHHKVVMVCQTCLLIIAQIAVIAMTVYSISLEIGEMLIMSVRTITVTVGLLLINNHLFKTVILALERCFIKACEDAER